MKPHNLTLTMIGAGLLWFGWYGFNVGSIVFTADSLSDPAKFSAQFYSETGVTFMNTTLATMAAMLAWLLMERILHGKATSLGAASGVVAGLVAITPACGAVNIARRARSSAPSPARRAPTPSGLKFKFGLDDSLDVVGVHLVGGIVGTCADRLRRHQHVAAGRRRALRRHRTACSTAATSTLLRPPGPRRAVHRSSGPACSPR